MLNATPERAFEAGGTPVPPAAAAVAPASTGAVLKLHVKGFSTMELRLLEGTVKLSQRRPPRIDLVVAADAQAADVVMIDAHDPQAMHWAALQPWLAGKPVIWAGAKAARAGHTVIDRHVKWPILPVLLYKAMEGAPRPGTAADATPKPGAQSSRRVLIVDDSLAARAHLRSLLERQGVEVVEAETAEAGIAAAAAEPYACVLMDVLMPGIDGFEACRRIKARARAGPALPVVMLTSKSSPFDRVRGKMAGCDTYLTKPVDPLQLREVIGRHVSGLPRPAADTATPRPPLGFRPSAHGGLA
jgi:two-component system, cell cycle response regulator